jgi:hypothetical protein
MISTYFLLLHWEAIFFSTLKNTKHIENCLSNMTTANRPQQHYLQVYRHKKTQGQSDLYCKPYSWSGGRPALKS